MSYKVKKGKRKKISPQERHRRALQSRREQLARRDNLTPQELDLIRNPPQKPMVEEVESNTKKSLWSRITNLFK